MAQLEQKTKQKDPKPTSTKNLVFLTLTSSLSFILVPMDPGLHIFLSMLLTCYISFSFLPTTTSAPLGQQLYLLFIFILPNPPACCLCIAVGSYIFAKFQFKKFVLNYRSLDYSALLTQ